MPARSKRCCLSVCVSLLRPPMPPWPPACLHAQAISSDKQGEEKPVGCGPLPACLSACLPASPSPTLCLCAPLAPFPPVHGCIEPPGLPVFICRRFGIAKRAPKTATPASDTGKHRRSAVDASAQCPAYPSARLSSHRSTARPAPRGRPLTVISSYQLPLDASCKRAFLFSWASALSGAEQGWICGAGASYK